MKLNWIVSIQPPAPPVRYAKLRLLIDVTINTLLYLLTGIPFALFGLTLKVFQQR